MVHAIIEQIWPGEVLKLTMPEPCPVALPGELLATQVPVCKVAGILVNAAVRDVAKLMELRLPIWIRFIRVMGPPRPESADLKRLSP